MEKPTQLFMRKGVEISKFKNVPVDGWDNWEVHVYLDRNTNKVSYWNKKFEDTGKNDRWGYRGSFEVSDYHWIDVFKY